MKYYNKAHLLNGITFAILLTMTVNSHADGFRLQEANTQNIIKDKWLCKYCPDPVSSIKSVTVNIAKNSDDNGRFSTATGDKNDNASAYFDADLDKRTENNHYRFRADGLGKDNSNVSLGVAKGNDYNIDLSYQTLNTFSHNDGLTPFINPGNSHLQLPDDWQRVPKTTDMPTDQFNTFYQAVEREQWQLALEKQFTDNWQAYLDFKSESKQGIKTTTGNILTKTVLLPTGIDQKHQQIDLGSYLSDEDGSLLLNYYHSDFNNKRSSVNWNSPYSVLFGGANSGQLSASPDNQFDQLSLFGHYRSKNINLQAKINYGQLIQTTSFLPYSNNDLLAVDALPVNNLNGEIKTFSTHIKALYQTDNHWKLSADYQLDDRDNNTQSNNYQHILSDSVILNDTRTNKPYSFNKEQLMIKSQYRFAIGSQLTLGWLSDKRTRNLQERKNVENEKFWVKISTHFTPFNNVSFELIKQFREGSTYQPILLNSPIDDTLALQKYNLADRVREQAKGQLSFSLNTLIETEVTLQTYFLRDRYNHTDIGLIESKQRGFDISFNSQIKEHLSLFVYSHNQWQDNLSQGSYWFNNVDWLGAQDDKSDTAGINLIAERLMDGHLTLGTNYTYSYGSGTTHVNSFVSDNTEQHKELTVNAQDIKFYADYQLSENTELHFTIFYQKFAENDWRFNYNIDQIINVLGNGLTTDDYNAYRITTGISYKF